MKNVYKVIIIIVFNFFLNINQIFAEAKNELSFSLATGNGIMENVKGMHTPVTNNPGTNIKGLVLDDDSLNTCLLYTSPSPRDGLLSRMPSSA